MGYSAVLTELQPDASGLYSVRMWKIENNFIKLEPCEVKEGSLFHVQIFPAYIRNINRNTEPLAVSNEFKYTPGNNIRKTLEHNICKIDEETLRVDVEGMKKTDNYFNYCFGKMKINGVTISNGVENEKVKHDVFTVENIFYFTTKEINVKIQKKDLNVC